MVTSCGKTVTLLLFFPRVLSSRVLCFWVDWVNRWIGCNAFILCLFRLLHLDYFTTTTTKKAKLAVTATLLARYNKLNYQGVSYSKCLYFNYWKPLGGESKINLALAMASSGYLASFNWI